MARAGWCGYCGAYVYVTSTGACPSGHGPEAISQFYEAPDPPGAPAAVVTGSATAIAEDAPTASSVEAVESAPAGEAGDLQPAQASEDSGASSAAVDELIAEASALADEHVRVERVGESSVVQADSLSAATIVGVLDRALALAPGDIDLMLAKSDMLYLGMQFKTAEDVLDEILGLDPGNFEARTRKEHWSEWSNVFTLPHWSEHETRLAAAMSQDFSQARSVQVVRSGVKVVPAVVRSVPAGEMAPGIGPQTRTLWEPVWSATPVGAIVAHYLIIEDNPDDPYRAEAFLPLGRSEKAARMNGYWLLRQLADADGCYIVLAEGDRVLYNRWCVYPPSVKAHLVAMAGQLDSATVTTDPTVFRQAMQWHMNSFDMDQVGFGRPLSDQAAGVAGF